MAKIEADDRRKFPRLNAKVTCRTPESRWAFKPVVDVSLGGMRIESDVEWTRGDEVEVEVFMPDDERARFMTRVVWIKPSDKGGSAKFEVGLRIIRGTREAIDRLGEVLAHDD